MDIDMNSTVTVDSLLNSYPSLKRVPDKDRIKCSWTQHEMPARVDAMEKYIQGKKYQQLLKKKVDSDDLEKYKEFLEPSTKKNHEKQLFCKLTWRHLNKEPHHIMKHIEGKKFKRAYAKWQECQVNGIEYTSVGKKKKKQQTVAEGDDNDDYVDLSDDEIVIDDDDDDDLSDLYPDFRRLRASDVKARTAAVENDADDKSGTKRKAEASQIKKPKKLAAPSSKRVRKSEETTTNGDVLVKSTKTMTITI
ncbi:unnamed protein product [Rotaria socialis]|uniref:Surfeit locus protein 2 n=1 Tax=Rotaria socialis TaxID=392032 RepID=A0A817WAK7_9BILA|nr:unnamed protein product [Rotaria socialis]CAF3421918.1 unnamed protein product [Rotaria socialis]CAF3505723.1 unnamed protein product [Rotaria socialis]CAF3751229.1 unnamed protein product [Rotaria socialis]CAF3810831.1 unnamed protein product [Rotaria socialis]